jgi:hypothetical protein
VIGSSSAPFIKPRSVGRGLDAASSHFIRKPAIAGFFRQLRVILDNLPPGRAIRTFGIRIAVVAIAVPRHSKLKVSPTPTTGVETGFASEIFSECGEFR